MGGQTVVGREAHSLPSLMGDSVEALLGGLASVTLDSPAARDRRSGPQTPLMRQLRVAEVSYVLAVSSCLHLLEAC